MDRERKRIGLSIRQLLPDPWLKKVEEHQRRTVGRRCHYTPDQIWRICSPGEELEGLIHVSELSEQRVAHPKEVVKEGDVVTCGSSRLILNAAGSV
jgi:small subunit ribosomal protein S1